jgi:hypothetical protein
VTVVNIAVVAQKEPPRYVPCVGDCRGPAELVCLGLVVAFIVIVLILGWSRGEDD